MWIRLHVSVLTFKNVKYEYLWCGIDILGGKPAVSLKKPIASSKFWTPSHPINAIECATEAKSYCVSNSRIHSIFEWSINIEIDAIQWLKM